MLGWSGHAPLSRDATRSKRPDGATHSGAQQLALPGGERAAVILLISRPCWAKRRVAPRHRETLGAPARDLLRGRRCGRAAAGTFWQLELPPTAHATTFLRMVVLLAGGPPRVLLDHATHAQLLLVIPVSGWVSRHRVGRHCAGSNLGRRRSRVLQSKLPPFVQPSWSTHVITRPLLVVILCFPESPDAVSSEASHADAIAWRGNWGRLRRT